MKISSGNVGGGKREWEREQGAGILPRDKGKTPLTKVSG
jgi:hypothetical protein